MVSSSCSGDDSSTNAVPATGAAGSYDAGPEDASDAQAEAGGSGGVDAAADAKLADVSADGNSDGEANDSGDDANDAVLPCPSNVPGVDSDGDGTPDTDDCLPCDPNVHPNVTAFSTVPRPDGSWDWNCDGIEELQYPAAGKCVGPPNCSPQQGFYSVPPCGGKGEKISYCLSYPYYCGIQWESTNSSTQGCR